jgi:hypothetical protein
MNEFDVYSRGNQSWWHARITVVDGRIDVEVDGVSGQLTRIQSEELASWLAVRLTKDLIPDRG